MRTGAAQDLRVTGAGGDCLDVDRRACADPVLVDTEEESGSSFWSLLLRDVRYGEDTLPFVSFVVDDSDSQARELAVLAVCVQQLALVRVDQNFLVVDGIFAFLIVGNVGPALSLARAS